MAVVVNPGLDRSDSSRLSNNNELAYREEIQSLSAWCSMNNLSLNATKTKELIVDFRKSNSSRHSPIYINESEVERVSSFKFLGIHISEDLSWHQNTSTLNIFPMRQHLLEDSGVNTGTFPTSSKDAAEERGAGGRNGQEFLQGK
ncbi:hypothetical protein QTP86_002573 [Hemibagrus guttatus]|nr:hypothetical protein QTP86_002573 [Hemibagrus guttatus]